MGLGPAFIGKARIDWTKYTANAVDLVSGGSTDVVADIQVKSDGNFYHIDELTATPGFELIVDFEDVTKFAWVQLSVYYNGSTIHAGLTAQLWNWDTSAWDSFCFVPHHATVGDMAGDMNNCDFFVGDSLKYIGADSDAGNVRVRVIHIAGGASAHDSYIDVIALYRD